MNTIAGAGTERRIMNGNEMRMTDLKETLSAQDTRRIFRATDVAGGKIPIGNRITLFIILLFSITIQL
jgi:hypothetical protein